MPRGSCDSPPFSEVSNFEEPCVVWVRVVACKSVMVFSFVNESTFR